MALEYCLVCESLADKDREHWSVDYKSKINRQDVRHSMRDSFIDLKRTEILA